MKRLILMGAGIMFSLFACAQSSDYDKKTKAMASVAAECAKNEKIIDLTGKKDPFNEAKQLVTGGEFISKNFKFKAPIMGIILSESNVTQADPSCTTATIEVMNFGNEGNTVLLTMNTSGEGEKGIYTWSWSGSKVQGVAPAVQGGVKTLVASRNYKPLGGLMQVEGKWLLFIDPSAPKSGMKEFYKGMTRSEVENVTKQLGLSKFKLSHKTNLYEVYSLYWVDMQKQYNIFGDYHFNMRNDKKYGDFYFNSAGKLIKWIIYM